MWFIGGNQRDRLWILEVLGIIPLKESSKWHSEVFTPSFFPGEISHVFQSQSQMCNICEYVPTCGSRAAASPVTSQHGHMQPILSVAS